MNKNLSQNNIVSYYDSEFPDSNGPINIFIKLDHVKEHVSRTDQVFYSVRPLCVKRGLVIDKNIDYYFNIKNYLVDMMKKSGAEYFVLIVDPTPREFKDQEGFAQQYYTSRLQTIHGESIISKLEEFDKPRLEEYPAELFEDGIDF